MSQPAQRQTKAEDLNKSDRDALEAAHARLRRAAAQYEPFLHRSQDSDFDAPVHELPEMLRAQSELQEAEAELWKLRERLLGWARPADAPPATQVTEWILEDEDQDGTK